jgi:hypothetical protein
MRPAARFYQARRTRLIYRIGHIVQLHWNRIAVPIKGSSRRRRQPVVGREGRTE